jgi:hypothetical protein
MADLGDVGVEGPSSAGTSTPTGNKRAESVLWFNDGIWWANMWDATLKRFYIFRLDAATQTWSNTGTLVERRASTHADVLWDGTKLFVATHRLLNDELPAEPGFPSHLYRYSYDSTTETYTLDAGFPTVVNNYKTETLTIDKDSRGRLWATWQQDNLIYLNSTGPDQTTWGTPFTLPGSNAVSVDDTSAVLAFGGDRIGVLYSSQRGPDGGVDDGMYWSVHRDEDPDTAWSTPVAALKGSRSADDHMNLKWLDASGGPGLRRHQDGVHLVGAGLDPAARLGHRGRGVASAVPHRQRVGVPQQGHRPVGRSATVDPDLRHLPGPGRHLHVLGWRHLREDHVHGRHRLPQRSGHPAAARCRQPVHPQRLVHQAEPQHGDGQRRAGLVLLAHNGRTARYWHHYEAPPVAVAPTASFTASPTSGRSAAACVHDTSTGSPTSWQWDLGNGATSTARHPATTYTAAGSTHRHPDGPQRRRRSTATQTVTVAAAPALTASFTRVADQRPCSAQRGVHRHLDRQPDQLALGLRERRRRRLPGTPPPPTPRRRLHRHADGPQRLRRQHGDHTITVAQALKVTITDGPPESTSSSEATFRFSVNEPATTQCRLDDNPFKACTSPVTYSGIRKGRHTFEVRATATNDGATASATWSWKKR